MLQGNTLELKGHMRYLGVKLSSILGFKEHILMARMKALKTTVALSRLMQNMKSPVRPIKRKLIALVVNGQLLYAARMWSSALVYHNYKQV